MLKLVRGVIVEKGGADISGIFWNTPKSLLEDKTIFTEDQSLIDVCT